MKDAAARKRSSRIGENPLDALIPKPKPRAAREHTAPPPVPQSTKVRATFHLPEDLFEAVRDAVVALSGPPYRLTLARFAEDALRRELARMQKEANGGKPFPKRSSELRGGRPIGS